MQMVDIEDAKEGMTIVADAKNNQGKVLLRAGTTLTDDLIKGLRALKVPGVYVDNDNDSQSPTEISPEISAEPEELTALIELEHKFSDVRGNVIMEEIMAAAKEHLKEKGSQNGTG
jgi:hypothetical protein